ncbi:hypothetical protein Sfr7A_16860 [Streptomyces xinghaiensis]|uniref:Uncharacterized protein n=2 Tax=Streptomyces TaxID=1883 RepID=A0A3M8F8J1_9ACTN|nr:hypothetical protein BEN35_10040 [Streptomyces fradiae]PQM22585.1 hypothetical protein Sfr7A_16860 [Streptomyces xinghaiensis]RKM96448.1 hypothetical protein SFRA_010245 [Streptomyces xinghaiensis]RNC74400.1 hypothetical protein DC095_011900 [Streptomyces xinghaiensis]
MVAMTTTHPAALPLLLGIVAAAVTGLGLVGYGFPAMGRGAVARGGAALSGALAALAYAWGLVSIFLDESGTAQACQDANPSLYGQVGDYSVSYLPPALNCRLSSGGSYEAAVPGFLTPVMTVCTVIAVILALIAVAGHHRTARPGPSTPHHPEKRNT